MMMMAMMAMMMMMMMKSVIWWSYQMDLTITMASHQCYRYRVVRMPKQLPCVSVHPYY